VWDALAKGAARDILSFRSVAEKLWRPFVAPIVDGMFGTRDFSRLMVAKRALFQSEDVLLDRVVLKVEGATTSAVSKGNYLFSRGQYLKLFSHA
jgi:origin recognition complex subunit 5